MSRRTETVEEQRRALRMQDPPSEERARYGPRPRDWHECEADPRPCPYVSCRYHLGLEVTAHHALVYPISEIEPWQAPETCALRVAGRGQILTLEEVGALTGLTREAVRQTQTMALLHLLAVRDDHPGRPHCAVCGSRSVGWLSGCYTHALRFGLRAEYGSAVLMGQRDLSEAWEAWVESYRRQVRRI